MPQAPDAATLHRRASALLADALDVAPDERGAWLEAACAGAPALRAEVDSLLAAHADAAMDTRLDEPIVLRPPRHTLLGADVGPWRVTGVLGEGGMGTVYRAERHDGAYDRTVALKMLRAADSRRLAGRFRDERRTLARLEHAGIARLYDGGVDPDGRPYLAMELVDGVPITAWARGEPVPGVAPGPPPSVEARLRVFVQACEAVAYAHARLIVHRDLKPSNLLVAAGEAADALPQVRLLDFGIAKLLDDDDAEAERTRTLLGPLTPAYAAPEQLRGEPVTTATDVYSLGLLLYEVLTGERPYSAAGLSLTELERRLDAPPPRPSETAAPTAARRLRGDLDTVVLQALAPEPERRYASAAALAEDLRRHLAGLPVSARAPTAGYRLLSFARRHRAGVAAGAVALLALVGGAGVALWQAREAAAARDRAEARFAIAQEAARAMLYDVHDAIASVEGSTAAREIIVTQSLSYLGRLADEAGDDPALRLDLASAYFRIGNVQGNPTDNNLGRTDEARASFSRGLALLPPPDALPDSLRARALDAAGNLHEKRGVVVAHVVAPDSALADLDRAVELKAQALALAPGDADQVASLAAAHVNRADYAGHPYFPNAERPAEALDHYKRARAPLLRIPPGAETVYSLRMLGITYEREGTLLRSRGDLADAVGPTRRALAIRLRIAERPDANAAARRDVGVSHEALGRLYVEEGRLDDGLRELRRALDIYRAVGRDDPENVNARETIAFGHLQLGHALRAAGRRGEARTHYAESARLQRALADREPDNPRRQQLAREAEAALDGA